MHDNSRDNRVLVQKLQPIALSLLAPPK